MFWLVLIYTVPSSPTRFRATVWRELKKAGAIYLRDGVAVLPDQATSRSAFRTIAGQIRAFGGQPTLIEAACLDPERETAIIAEATASREEEYSDVVREAERFLVHIEGEREHRDLTVADLDEIAADLDKLKRWIAQIRQRDHFGSRTGGRVDALIAQCERTLAAFLDEEDARTGEGGG